MSTLGRGLDCRVRQLPDLFYYTSEYTRPHKAWVFATVSKQGKTNKNNHSKYLSFIRHLDVAACPVAALHMAFLMRREVLRASQLSQQGLLVRDPRQHHRPAMLVEGAAERESTTGPRPCPDYTQHRHFKAIFRKAGVATVKLTHVRRVQGSKDL